MEVLKVMPSQRFAKRLSPNQISEMIKATLRNPQERKSKIGDAVKRILDYSSNPYLNSFGLTVGSEMLQTRARILDAPKLVFRDNRAVGARDGAWNLRGQRLVSAPPISSLAFVFFVKVRQQEADEISNDLMQKWAQTGVNLQCEPRKVPILIANPVPPGAVLRTLQLAFKQATAALKTRCQLLVCVLDKEPQGLYRDIKRITLTDAGVLSQCILFKNVSRGIKDQYASNVALKVNIKLGGSTNTVDNLPLFDRPTMLVGADVTHGVPGSNAPSVAAVVTSMDKHATRYNTFLRAQGPRVEVISSMESVVGEGLDRFKNSTGTYPKRVIVFRDGVGYGQFDEIREKECKAIKRALASRGLAQETRILFIVVQKRHHIRLFPLDRVMDRSGNCVPGTVIDSDITHPFEYNFILQSHAGIQGTSRPTIYYVIYDEIKIDPDILQQLCYNLCYLAERATRSISIVAPTYRAHIAAFCKLILLIYQS